MQKITTPRLIIGCMLYMCMFFVSCGDVNNSNYVGEETNCYKEVETFKNDFGEVTHYEVTSVCNGSPQSVSYFDGDEEDEAYDYANK